MMKQKVNKILVAYSGGLDTSVIVSWLLENYDNPEIIAMTANVGQEEDFDALEEKALKSGATKLYVEDLRKEFLEDYVFEALKAEPKYDGRYLLGTAFARPLMSKRMVEIAHQEGCDAIAHGCTGKGNDQVRFELAIREFDPHIKIIAPWREWDLKSRDDEYDYAEERGIPLTFSREEGYSEDDNLFHISHEGLDLEDPTKKPDYDSLLTYSVSPQNAPDKAAQISVSFEKGIPVAVNGKKMEAIELMETLNKIGGENAIGILDIVENRLVGMKSRGVYETPGGEILYHAHNKLEEITIDRDTFHYKQQVSIKYAELLYNGLWYSPLRKALQAFVDDTQKNVTGTVEMELYKGNIIDVSVTSPYSLYNEELASFDEDDIYEQNDAEGFIKLFGLPQTTRTIAEENWKI